VGRYIGAIDQGTTSTRFVVFDRAGHAVASAGKALAQIYPGPGLVEHDAAAIWHDTVEVIARALRDARLAPSDLAAIGIANQRETTVLWDRHTGEPLHNALVWQDTRVDARVAELSLAGGRDRLRATTGLPLASYFSGLKLAWLLDAVPGARRAAEQGDALFGTIDSWLLWNLTGGPEGGRHATDVTNASRTQLFDIGRLAWDPAILELMAIPPGCLPLSCPQAVSPDIAVQDRSERRSPGSSATSRPPLSAMAAFCPATARTRTGRAASC
jgi:glycerol kinase